ncbi:MAG: ATPase [Desulfobulbaceae bacterium DB1]|nr:MAG: ATPase [Desulfobulbaceae bacterium DB1]
MRENKTIARRRSLRRIIEMHPAPLVAFSFVLFIIAGSFSLMLPAATQSGDMHFIDALFTATSAVCVTGLAVVDTGTFFSTFGQCIILALMQIGGLGVMTVSIMLFRAIGRSITFRQRMVLQDVFAHTPREDILHVLKTIIGFTFLAEAGGFIFLYLHWSAEFPPARAAFLALFHAVSAFCNAGFSLFPDSMVRYSNNILLNFTICGLIVTGGIGFPVVHDIFRRTRQGGTRRTRLSVQTKTVLLTTIILIVVGSLMYWLLEYGHSLAGKSLSESLLVSLFQSITCRTAGFNTADIAALNPSTLTMMIGLMFFGASPGSCGGGVKTTTLAVIILFTWSRIRHKKRVNIFHKSIPSETISRSLSLALVATCLIGVTLFLLLAGDTFARIHPSVGGEMFLAYLFETVSAFGTVGLSMGLTTMLSTWGKLLIIFLMLVGRVGVLTFSYIIIGGAIADGIEYAEENIMIG